MAGKRNKENEPSNVQRNKNKAASKPRKTLPKPTMNEENSNEASESDNETIIYNYDEEMKFVVGAVVDHKLENDQLWVEVQWQGYPDQNTWEIANSDFPESSLYAYSLTDKGKELRGRFRRLAGAEPSVSVGIHREIWRTIEFTVTEILSYISKWPQHSTNIKIIADLPPTTKVSNTIHVFEHEEHAYVLYVAESGWFVVDGNNLTLDHEVAQSVSLRIGGEFETILYQNCARLDYCCSAAALATLELLFLLRVTQQVPRTLCPSPTLKKRIESRFYPDWTGSRMAKEISMRNYVKSHLFKCPRCEKNITKKGWGLHKC